MEYKLFRALGIQKIYRNLSRRLGIRPNTGFGDSPNKIFKLFRASESNRARRLRVPVSPRRPELFFYLAHLNPIVEVAVVGLLLKSDLPQNHILF